MEGYLLIFALRLRSISTKNGWVKPTGVVTNKSWLETSKLGENYTTMDNFALCKAGFHFVCYQATAISHY